MNLNAGLRACLIAWACAMSLSGCRSDDAAPSGDATVDSASSASEASPPTVAGDTGSYRSVENSQTVLTSADGTIGDEHLMQAVPGEYLIKFKARTGTTAAQRTLSKVTLSGTRSFNSVTGLHLVKLGPEVDPQTALATYRASPEVEYIEPNYRYRSYATPNDPSFGSQWGLHNTGQTGGLDDADIDAPEAWDITTGGNDVVIAVIDSGVDYTHPDLAANLFRNVAECTPDGVDNDGNQFVDDCYGIDAVNGDSDPYDDNGHGTSVAGVIGAVGNNGIGITGVAWNVKILPCKFSDSTGTGLTSSALACFDYIARMKARGVNIVAANVSWGNSLSSRALEDAIREQMSHGILTIASAGNSGLDNDRMPGYPCSYYVPNVICVAALTNGGWVPLFSNRGRTSVHLGAPGENILTTVAGGGYALSSGTSLASPFVAGTAALLAAQSPGRDWRAIKNLILAGTVNPNQANLIAGQQLNAQRSLTCNNSVTARRLRPSYFPFEELAIVSAVGAPIELAVQHINCASPNGAVSVSIQPGGATITLLDDGSGKDAAAGDGIYTAEWIPSYGGTFDLTFPGNDVVEVTVDPLLKSGFPVKTPHTAGTYKSGLAINVLVGNIDADPEQEVIASALANGPLYAWDANGAVVPGWPTLDGWAGAAYPVLGEFDQNVAGREIFTTYMGSSRAIYYGDGRPMPGYPRAAGVGGVPMAADLNGDGVDEILWGGTTRVDGEYFNANGSPFLDGELGAIGDLDGDGDLEFVDIESGGGISQGSIVRAFHHDGSSIFVKFLSGQMTITHPVIGDVDADGAAEIVLITVGYPREMRLHILAMNGDEERSVLLSNSMSVPPVAHQALADMDGDGLPEIVVHGASLSVLKGDGSALPGWPVPVGSHGPMSTPVIGDITGDGLPDVVTLCESRDICAFERDGTPVAGFPKTQVLLGPGGAPAIADLDLDGRNELIVVGQFWGGFTGLYDKLWVYDLGGPAAFGPIEWGQLKGGTQRHGNYETGKNLTTDAYLTAHTRGAGTITAQDGRISCESDCIERYRKGTSITLTAAASAGQVFTGWRGACAGQQNPCSVSIQHYTSVVAEFAAPVALTVAIAGSGSGTIAANTGSIACPSDCTDLYSYGTAVTLTASAAADSIFSHWSGACNGTASTCTVTLTGNRAVTANFIVTRTLTVTNVGDGSVRSSPGGIQCGIDCTEAYVQNTSVTLTAVPASGSVFAGWSGACAGRVTTCTLNMNAARSVTATFTTPAGPGPVSYPLQVIPAGTGSGTVISSVAGINCGSDCIESYVANSQVTLTADANAGSMFTGWSGACTGTGSCVLTMDSGASVSATFVRLLTVDVAVTGSGNVTSNPAAINCPADCDESVMPNTTLVLTATPSAGYALDSWSGACSGRSTTCSVLVDSAKSVTVSFRAVPASSGSGTGNSGGSSGGGGGSVDPWLLAALSMLAFAGSSTSRRVGRPRIPTDRKRKPDRHI